VFAYSPAPEAGFAVITERFVCLLSADAPVGLARELFRILDATDARLDDALAALAPVDVVERFALIELLDEDDRSTRVAVRGQVSVGIEGTTTTRLSAPGGATWITGEARGVSALWLSMDDSLPGDELLPLGRGIVRARAVAAESVYPGSAAAEAGSLRVEHEEGDERWILRLPDGNELDADGTIVIGRTSWEHEDDADEVKHVSVPSPMRQISGSHLELALVDGELVARDLDSTNGTIVLTPERPPRLLHGGSTTSLQTGDILDLGESFRIVVSSRH